MRKIKAYTLRDGVVNFTILEYMPEVGDYYEHEEVLEIQKLKLTGRQPFAPHEVQGDGECLEFFRIITTMNGDPDDPLEYYVAGWVKIGDED